MKTISILMHAVLLQITGIQIYAQTSEYKTIMKENIEKLNIWADSPQSLSATFERIALAEKDKWQPYYYTAYANVICAFMLKTAEEKDKLIEKTQIYLNTAFTLNPDSSELYAVQGYLHLAYLQADPMSRSAEYSRRALEAFEKAIQLNPNNPRPYFLKATCVLYTPEFYGGGKTAAKPIFELAKSKFEQFTPATELAPNWGKEDCQKQLTACN